MKKLMVAVISLGLMLWPRATAAIPASLSETGIVVTARFVNPGEVSVMFQIR